MADLSGLSDEDRQQALDIGSSMRLEGTAVDAGEKSPDMTPTIGDDPPEYGKTFVATPESEPLPEASVEVTPEAPPEALAETPPEAVAEPEVTAEPPPVPDSLAGMSEEDLQAVRDIGASTPLESTFVDSADKSPDLTPAIGDDRPEYGKTFDATPEPDPLPSAQVEAAPEASREAVEETLAEAVAEPTPEVDVEPPPVPDSLAGMSDEDLRAARDIGASTPLEGTTVDSSDKLPDMTPAIGDQTPEYGKTFDATPEPIAEMAPDAPTEMAPEGVPEAALEVTAEAPPEVQAEATPEATPEAIPDVAPEAPVDAGPDVTTEVAPEVTPEVVLEATPEMTTEAASTNPEVAADALLENENRQIAIETAAESQISEHLAAAYGEAPSGVDYSSPLPEPSPELVAEPTRGPEIS